MTTLDITRPSNTIEIWKPAPNFENLYSVSNLGRVRRDLSRRCTKAGRILVPHRTKKGYLTVELCDRKRAQIIRLHQLVMLAFVGAPPEKLIINHKNGIKTDCQLENLEYVTQSDNQIHAIKTGLKVQEGFLGIKHPNARLNEEDVKAIRELKGKELIKTTADRFGIKYGTVRDIQAKRRWGHIE